MGTDSDFDDDLLNLLGDDNDTTNDEGRVDLSEFKALIDDLKKENQGLLNAKQDEKRKRQETQQRLSKIETTLSQILETKKTATENVDAITKTAKGIPVEFATDGTAFIPADKLNEVLTPHQQKVQQLEEELTNTKNASAANQKAAQIIQSIVAEDPKYPAVYAKYSKARAWVNNKVVEYQKENNIRGLINSAHALDVVITPEVEQEFAKEFPDMDLESVVIAEDSVRLFKKMLVLNSPKVETKNQQIDEKFKKVLNKPSTLGNAANAKRGEQTVLDKLEALTASDILNLSDAQVKALEAAMREEELRG